MGYTVIPTIRSFSATHAGQVMRRLRRQPLTRAELSTLLGLSSASISRVIAALIKVGLVVEATSPRPARGLGRPELPVELDCARNLALGFAVGARRTIVSVSDLRGTVLARRFAGQGDGLREAAKAARSLLRRLPGATVRTAGLIGVAGAELPATAMVLTELLGFDVVAADRGLGVTLAALVADYPLPGTGVFIHGDEVEWGAMVLAMEPPDITSAVNLALSHFPTSADTPCSCGRRGCLAAAVPPDSVSREISLPAAQLVGEVVARIQLMTRADHIFLVGEAFGNAQAWSRLVAQAGEADCVTGGLRASVLRGGTEAASSCNAALLPLYEDPVGVIRDGIEGVARYARAC